MCLSGRWKSPPSSKYQMSTVSHCGVWMHLRCVRSKYMDIGSKYLDIGSKYLDFGSKYWLLTTHSQAGALMCTIIWPKRKMLRTLWNGFKRVWQRFNIWTSVQPKFRPGYVCVQFTALLTGIGDKEMQFSKYPCFEARQSGVFCCCWDLCFLWKISCGNVRNLRVPHTIPTPY